MAKAGVFILMVGDEGAILTYLQAGKVVRRLYAASANYTDTRGFLECFEADVKAPISLLVDFMDQSYVQQSLPPVSSLSINGLIKRKMQRDFAASDLKGAMRIGREETGRRDWKYLFVSLAKSPQLDAWLDLLLELPNKFQGIYLLPVEAIQFIYSLEAAVTGRKLDKLKKGGDDLKPEWTLLVMHNKVGGFRQVVLRKGRLIFARLAQPIGEAQADVIAGNIEQEVSVTIEYLKRLGYDDEQGMGIYIVTAEAIKRSVDPANIAASQSHLFTPHEVSTILGYDQVTEPSDQFADVIMSASFARTKKRMLPLSTPAVQKLHMLYNSILGTKIFASLATLGLIGFLLMTAIAIPGFMEEIETLEGQERRTQQSLQDAKEAEAELPEDLDKITDLVDMYNLLTAPSAGPLEVARGYLNAAKEFDVLVRELQWTTQVNVLAGPDDKKQGDGNQPEGVEADIQVKVDADMYETQQGTEHFNQRVNAYVEKLHELMPAYHTELKTKLPGVSTSDRLSLAEAEAEDPILSQESLALSLETTGPHPLEEKNDANNEEAEDKDKKEKKKKGLNGG